MNRTAVVTLTILALLAAVVGLGAYVKFEGSAPVCQFDPELPKIIGQKKTFKIRLSEAGQGLRSARLLIIQGETVKTLADESWPSRYGILGNRQTSAEIEVTIEPGALGLKNGPARLELDVRDHSWRESFHGNKFVLTQEVVIDTCPPVITVESSAHYLRPGGCGLAVYRVSEEGTSGVMVGERFFKGVPVDEDDPGLLGALFAVPYDTASGVKLWIKAVDRAGNQSGAGFNHILRTRRYRHSKINLSQRFLARKMPEFRKHYPNLPQDDVAAFLIINRDLRSQNNKQIAALTSKVTPTRLWEGRFKQLKNSARTASFGDARTYFYNGKEIDRQVHMGLDLASTANAAVGAANRGRVVFADYLGIYGLTVILDHGQGLYSLYGHLSSIAVTKGLSVAQGDTLGQTGSTGLAGGDHLHFAMICGGVYVDPIEWLDPRWIEHNITSKIEAAKKGG